MPVVPMPSKGLSGTLVRFHLPCSHYIVFPALDLLRMREGLSGARALPHSIALRGCISTHNGIHIILGRVMGMQMHSPAPTD